MLAAFDPTPNENIVKASVLAANSLLNTASFVEVFRGHESERVEMLQFLFTKNIAMAAQRSEESLYYFYSDSGELECFFMLVPSDFSKFSFCEQMSWGLYEFPFRCGFEVTARLTAAGDWYDRVEAEIMKDYPKYLVLQRMVVAPKVQGKSVFLLHFPCVFHPLTTFYFA